MAKEQNNILHRWFEEVWNNGRTEVIDEMIAPNAIAHGLEDPSDTKGNEVSSRKNSRNSITAFAARFRKFTSASKKWFQKVTWSSAIAKSRQRIRVRALAWNPPASRSRLRGCLCFGCGMGR